ncbi:hypothetical protein CEXT_99141 [Caerostris extrusa]|uniref:Uncharacterized protein n=1 Tax=Caerostris extrusa TaxID=172846 RepID=A0AAV4NWT8_CAEEX|nr:hypothetical protein CEXT_99141 [Caerostris extrusa]
MTFFIGNLIFNEPSTDTRTTCSSTVKWKVALCFVFRNNEELIDFPLCPTIRLEVERIVFCYDINTLTFGKKRILYGVVLTRIRGQYRNSRKRTSS